MTIAEADTNVATAAVVVVMTANAIAAAIVVKTAAIAASAAIKEIETAGQTRKSCSRNARFKPKRRAHAKQPQVQDCSAAPNAVAARPLMDVVVDAATPTPMAAEAETAAAIGMATAKAKVVAMS